MLASRPKMLSEVIKSMVQHQPDMEVVGEVLDPIELLMSTRMLSVDVVIIAPLEITGEPRICAHLLEKNPFLKIIVLSSESKSGFLFQSDAQVIQIDDPTEEAVFNAIRHSFKKEITMNIYVGNLAHDVREDDLRQAFEAFGKVESASVIKDRYTGESKGFGFIEMFSKDEAQTAMDTMNGKELKGQNLIVNEARPRSNKNRGGGRRGGGGGGGRRF